MDAIDEILNAADLTAVVSRELVVRVLNISTSGCLIEATGQVPRGTVATLRARIDGVDFRDPVQVVWCRRLEGAGETWRAGAEFLWTELPDEHSLRRVTTRLQQQGSVHASIDVGVMNHARPM